MAPHPKSFMGLTSLLDEGAWIAGRPALPCNTYAPDPSHLVLYAIEHNAQLALQPDATFNYTKPHPETPTPTWVAPQAQALRHNTTERPHHNQSLPRKCSLIDFLVTCVSLDPVVIFVLPPYGASTLPV